MPLLFRVHCVHDGIILKNFALHSSIALSIIKQLVHVMWKHGDHSALLPCVHIAVLTYILILKNAFGMWLYEYKNSIFFSNFHYQRVSRLSIARTIIHFLVNYCARKGDTNRRLKQCRDM